MGTLSLGGPPLGSVLTGLERVPVLFRGPRVLGPRWGEGDKLETIFGRRLAAILKTAAGRAVPSPRPPPTHPS